MKIEMHAHTSEASPCASTPASRMVSLYCHAGYDAVVVTDHYCKWVYDQSGAGTPEQYAEYFLSGFSAAEQAARKTSLKILLGAEVNLTENPNDYLLYGATADFFRNNPGLFTLSLKDFSDLCHKNGILVFQAHPFRTYCSPANPAYLDGAESYNGNRNHDNQNELACSWVTAHHLIPSSGSDFHGDGDAARGGIQTSRQITDIAGLCRLLKDGDYQLIRDC